MAPPIFYAPHTEILGPLDLEILQEMVASGDLPPSTLFWYDDGYVPQWLDWREYSSRLPPTKSRLRVEMEKIWTSIDPDWSMKAMALWLQKLRRRQGYCTYPLHPVCRTPLYVGNPIISTIG